MGEFRDGSIVPFPLKFPEQADIIKEGVQQGLIEIANHGLTHCVTENRAFLPRFFSSNRNSHREFWPQLSWNVLKTNISIAQDILHRAFQQDIVTFVPSGSVFPEDKIAHLTSFGFQYFSSKGAAKKIGSIFCIGEEDVSAIHDRDIYYKGREWFKTFISETSHCHYKSIKDFMKQKGLNK